jgi:hypothetical protein
VKPFDCAGSSLPASKTTSGAPVIPGRGSALAHTTRSINCVADSERIEPLLPMLALVEAMPNRPFSCSRLRNWPVASSRESLSSE